MRDASQIWFDRETLRFVIFIPIRMAKFHSELVSNLQRLFLPSFFFFFFFFFFFLFFFFISCQVVRITNVLAGKFSGKSLLSPRRLCSTIYSEFDLFLQLKIYARYKLDKSVIRIIAKQLVKIFSNRTVAPDVFCWHCDLCLWEIFKNWTNESSIEIKLPKKIFLEEEIYNPINKINNWRVSKWKKEKRERRNRPRRKSLSN